MEVVQPTKEGINSFLGDISCRIQADRGRVLQYVDIHTPTGPKLALKATHSWGFETDTADVPLETLEFFRTEILKGLFICCSVEEIPKASSAERHAFVQLYLKSLVCLPLIHKGRVIGHLSFHHTKQEKDMTKIDHKLLLSASSALTQAIVEEVPESDTHSEGIINEIYTDVKGFFGKMKSFVTGRGVEGGKSPQASSSITLSECTATRPIVEIKCEKVDSDSDCIISHELLGPEDKLPKLENTPIFPDMSFVNDEVVSSAFSTKSEPWAEDASDWINRLPADHLMMDTVDDEQHILPEALPLWTDEDPKKPVSVINVSLNNSHHLHQQQQQPRSLTWFLEMPKKESAETATTRFSPVPVKEEHSCTGHHSHSARAPSSPLTPSTAHALDSPAPMSPLILGSKSPAKVPSPTGKSNLQCCYEGCGKFFSTPANLRRHERIHQGLRPYGCQQCGKHFARQSELRVHERIHADLKPYPCTHEGCNKAFVRAYELKMHSLLHSGSKPFVCDMPNCTKSFLRRSDLRTHMRIHTGERPYRCPFPGCTHAATTSSNLSKHQKKHEGEANHPCKSLNFLKTTV